MSTTQSPIETAVPPTVESDQAKLVYLYLDRAGGATPATVSEALSLPKLAVFGVLRTLRERGVVEKRDGRYRPA
jgi:sugar-specific transcriptional regulator TrmB